MLTWRYVVRTHRPPVAAAVGDIPVGIPVGMGVVVARMPDLGNFAAAYWARCSFS